MLTNVQTPFLRTPLVPLKSGGRRPSAPVGFRGLPACLPCAMCSIGEGPRGATFRRRAQRTARFRWLVACQPWLQIFHAAHVGNADCRSVLNPTQSIRRSGLDLGHAYAREPWSNQLFMTTPIPWDALKFPLEYGRPFLIQIHTFIYNT